MRKTVTLGLSLLLLAALGPISCGTETNLESQWELPNLKSKPFAKVAVIAVLKNKDAVDGFESTVVSDFNKRGVQAVPGFSFLGGKKKMTKEEMEKLVNDTGADGVLIFKELAVDKSHHYVPPTTYVVPDGFGDWWDDDYWGYYNPYPWGYWGYWYPATQVVTTPGYWKTAVAYRVETSLYRVSDNKLIWTGISETYNPETRADMASSIANVVFRTLEKDDLIVK